MSYGVVIRDRILTFCTRGFLCFHEANLSLTFVFVEVFEDFELRNFFLFFCVFFIAAMSFFLGSEHFVWKEN